MNDRTFLYVGCYTNESPVGIRIFDARLDHLTEIGEVSDIEHPSFLVPHPSGAILYAVSETSNGKGDGGGVVALRIDPSDGSLTPLQHVPSGGDAPCHLGVDAAGENLYVANYVSGSVTAYRLESDGRIGDLAFSRRHAGRGPTERQEGPHAHCAVPHAQLPGFVVADLGIDTIIHYGRDGDVEGQVQLPSGAGPRHVAWHPTLPIGFVVGELDNTITIVEIDPDNGRLSTADSLSTLPPTFKGHSLAAEVQVNRAGSRVYVSNRGSNSIATFEFTNGSLELVAHVPSGGQTPRHFALHPSVDSLVVANQGSNRLNRFHIANDGVAIPADHVDEVPEPVCVTFLAASS